MDEERGAQLSHPGTDLEYQFHTTQYVYFKNSRCRELDEYLGYAIEISFCAKLLATFIISSWS